MPHQTHTAGTPDESGSVAVTVDASDRVRCVDVVRDDPRLRRPEGLDEAVAGAAMAARAARRRATRRGGSGEEPGDLVAQGPVSRPVLRVDDWTDRPWQLRTRPRRPHHYRPKDLRPAVGFADNQCVRVTLGLASSHGVVEADPGWLANAQLSQVGKAVTEAFAHAYRERDES